MQPTSKAYLLARAPNSRREADECRADEHHCRVVANARYGEARVLDRNRRRPGVLFGGGGRRRRETREPRDNEQRARFPADYALILPDVLLTRLAAA